MESDSISVVDNTEEEKRETGEKDMEEKILQWREVVAQHEAILPVKRIRFVHYAEGNSSFSSEILLPPPKQAI